MATFLETAGNGDISSKDVFEPQVAFTHPYNVTLVIKDGKEVKAHRHVLSNASPFFEKLLNSDMKENKEGVVRLEMLTESVLKNILEFIYTGCVQLVSGEDASDLIAMADYLFLPELKSLAGRVLVQTLDASNSISTYHFAKRYQCEELVTETENFIFANFGIVAKTEDFLNMSSCKEVATWISSDEIVVDSEEDVFNIILTWVLHDKSRRVKHFAELFRHVRLVYVSRDFLRSKIVKNKLVNDDRSCQDLVKAAVRVNDSKSNNVPAILPRKSLETPVIVVISSKQSLCYFPREDKWCKSCISYSPRIRYIEAFSCHSKLYFITQKEKLNGQRELVCYDSLTDCWKSLPCSENRDVKQIFVGNDNEIYAFVCENETSCSKCASLSFQGVAEYEVLFGIQRCGKRHLSSITKYKSESNSWEDILTFDFQLREGICFVAKDSHLYFIGGNPVENRSVKSRNVDRYDLCTKKWDKTADMQRARSGAKGAVIHGKIFIADKISPFGSRTGISCEVYDEEKNEWQLIADCPAICYHLDMIGVVDRELYIVTSQDCTLKCYNPDKNEWSNRTKIPQNLVMKSERYVSAFSMRVFNGSQFLNKLNKQECFIM